MYPSTHDTKLSNDPVTLASQLRVRSPQILPHLQVEENEVEYWMFVREWCDSHISAYENHLGKYITRRGYTWEQPSNIKDGIEVIKEKYQSMLDSPPSAEKVMKYHLYDGKKAVFKPRSENFSLVEEIFSRYA
jgi:hypothetical protein